MAKCKRKQQSKVVFRLDLTEDEAGFLRAVTGRYVVGGGHARDLNDSIFKALAAANVRSIPLRTRDGVYGSLFLEE